jgi:hypothetical protein
LFYLAASFSASCFVSDKKLLSAGKSIKQEKYQINKKNWVQSRRTMGVFRRKRGVGALKVARGGKKGQTEGRLPKTG